MVKMISSEANNLEFNKVPGIPWATVTRCGVCKNPKTGRVLKPHYDKDGYLKVSTRYNRKAVRAFVHRLVALTYIPKIENKPSVNHINGIKTDNRVENLEWSNNTEQQTHGYIIGLKPKFYGEDNFSSKYTEKLIREICEDLEKGVKRSTIVKRLGLKSSSLVGDILSFKSWRTVSLEYNIRRKYIPDETVINIYKMLKAGISVKDTAVNFGIGKGYVAVINEGLYYQKPIIEYLNMLERSEVTENPLFIRWGE